MILSPGEQVAGFRVVAPIAAGGMAVVYEAEQVRLKRRVALKILNERLGRDDSYRERFIREGTHIAALEHPNIVPVYDAGEHDDRLYIAMRFVDGETLADRLAPRRLPPEEVHSILAPIARALDAAHEARIIHRDIKPGNILIDSQGNSFLADFGIARAATATHTLTTVGSFVGSVHYAAPEQARGDAPTPASDIYSLAIVFYQCITGDVPYRSETESNVLDAHMHSQIPTIPVEFGGNSRLNTAIARGMAKRPEDRFATATELAAAIDAALEPSVVEPPPAVDATGEAPVTPASAVTAPTPPTEPTIDVPLPVDPHGTVVVESTTVDPRDEGYVAPPPPKEPRFKKSTLVLAGCVAVALLLPTIAFASSQLGESEARVGTSALGVVSPDGGSAKTAESAKSLGLDPATALVYGGDEFEIVLGSYTEQPEREGGLPPELAKQFTAAPKVETVEADGRSARRYTGTLKKGPMTDFSALVFESPDGKHLLAGCMQIPGADVCSETLGSILVKQPTAPIGPTEGTRKEFAAALASLREQTRGVSLKSSNVTTRANSADKLAETYAKTSKSVAKIDSGSPREEDQLTKIAATMKLQSQALSRLATASRTKNYAEYAKQKSKLARYQRQLRREIAAF